MKKRSAVDKKGIILLMFFLRKRVSFCGAAAPEGDARLSARARAVTEQKKPKNDVAGSAVNSRFIFYSVLMGDAKGIAIRLCCFKRDTDVGHRPRRCGECRNSAADAGGRISFRGVQMVYPSAVIP